MDGGRGRRGGGMVGLLLVQALREYYRLERKPPVTAALIAANTLIYFRRPRFLHHILPTLHQVSFNPYLILKHKDLKRLLLSVFYHIGEPHLVYNMLSLLWKGIQLETSMGSVQFASMVAALLGMSQCITLLLAKALLLFDYERPYYNEHAVGFSGVLFAMKVVLYSESDHDYTYVHGVMVPARYAAWAELVLVQMFVPNVSFLGHLGGILAGVLYLYLKRLRSGPANTLVKIIRGVLGWPFRFARGLVPTSQGRRFFGRGTVGVWRCGVCTFDNDGGLMSCEMCGTGRGGGEHLGSDDDDTQTSISLEELRQRRVQRFR